MKTFLVIGLLMAVLCSSASALVISGNVTWTTRTKILDQTGGYVEIVAGGSLTANARVDHDGGVGDAGRVILNGGDLTSTVDFKHPDNNTGNPAFIGIYDGTFTANQIESFGLVRDATIEIGANGTLIVQSQYSAVTANDGNRYNVGNMILEGSIYASSGYDLVVTDLVGSAVQITAVVSGPDTSPPTPNPATFAAAPAAGSDTAIIMMATTGSDSSGPVEYRFTETSGNPGGTSSSWQTSPSHFDSGLNASTQYTYTVQMRDALGYTGTASIPASATTNAPGKDFNYVPGEVIYWRISPFSHLFGSNRIYTSGCSIAKMDNGDYLISFSLFGSSLSPSHNTSGTTYVYRSSDQGQTWINLTPSPIMDLTRSSLFIDDDITYMWGYTYSGGNPVLYKSTNYGLSWTSSVLSTSTRNGTPFNPVIADDSGGTPRVWCAVGGRRLMSGRKAEGLIMNSSYWTNPGSAGNVDQQPAIVAAHTIDSTSEAQIVYSPQAGVFVMPKVRFTGVSAPYWSYTVLLEMVGDNDLQDATADDWVTLPGAEKKFAASYDPVSGKFYVLSNPVLAEDESGTGWAWELIRNTAAMISSKDLKHWDVEQIFLYSTDIDHEGFQYLNFDYDGDDMIIASRTAFDISVEPDVSYAPPRGHDSNMITFHRINNFRTAAPTHYLAYSGSSVTRHEETQYQDAPLGSFVLGSTFDGAALGTVNGMGQDVNGDVYVRETGGDILRFDALGNFIETAVGSPVPLESSPLSISQPAYGERTWIKSGGGNWEDLANWYYWGRPDTDYEVATLGSAITGGRALTLDKAYTMKGLRFRSPYTYTLAGSGQITIEADTGKGILDVREGTHSINVPVVLGSDTDAWRQNGTELRFNAGVSLNGKVLSIKGQGRLVILNQFAMNGGRIVLDGLSPLTFSGGASAVLNGQFEFAPDASFHLSLGAVFQLLDGDAMPAGPFAELLLPVLPEGLKWDNSALYTSGTLVIVPDEWTNLIDFSFLALWWLNEDCDNIPGCSYYDLVPDGILDLDDLHILANRWLDSG